jgi:hypothetical protein
MIGRILIVVHVVVWMTSFSLRGQIMCPWLIPIFGVPFAIMDLAVQYGLVFYLRSLRGAFLVTGVFLLCMLISGTNLNSVEAHYYAAHHISAIRGPLVLSVCTSGWFLGAALLSQWVAQEQ